MSDRIWQCKLCTYSATYYVVAGQGLPYSGEMPWLLQINNHLLEHVALSVDPDEVVRTARRAADQAMLAMREGDR